jgi:hypothetical protein
MKRIGMLVSVWVTLASVATAIAPSAQVSAATKPKFSSTYTDFAKCTYTDEADLQEGQDASATCPGPNGYQIMSSPSAFGEQLYAVKDDEWISLAMVPFSYLGTKGRKLEWRMAKGAPFAAILRVDTYRESDDGNPVDAKLKTGSVIKVVGLVGYEQIAGSVNTKTKSANEKARALADRQYK